MLAQVYLCQVKGRWPVSFGMLIHQLSTDAVVNIYFNVVCVSRRVRWVELRKEAYWARLSALDVMITLAHRDDSNDWRSLPLWLWFMTLLLAARLQGLQTTVRVGWSPPDRQRECCTKQCERKVPRQIPCDRMQCSDTADRLSDCKHLTSSINV